MDLRSHYPYWLLKNGIIASYPSIGDDQKADIAVIGAGITGALTAWHLAKGGFNVVVLDRRHAGMGSTAASTSLLQYEIDVPLVKLQRLVGKKNAETSYLLSRQAIFDVGEICAQLTLPVEFGLVPSLQYASFAKDLAALKKECVARKNIGIDLTYLEGKEIFKKFHIKKFGGLLSRDAGHVDSYRLTHALLMDVEKMGGKVFDHSEVREIKHSKNGVELIVDPKHKVKAKKLVIACGYESLKYIPQKIERFSSTFVIISEQYPKQDFWYKNALIWETANPYLYLKVTPDNRIVIGGKDIPFSDPVKRDALLNIKAKQLEQAFKKLFPHIPFKTDFKWAGTFSSSKDGLPYIGSIPERPNTYFALGFGGNGITFSVIAAQMITDLAKKGKTKNEEVFSFTR